MNTKFDFGKAVRDFESNIRSACTAQLLVHDYERAFKFSEKADALGEKIVTEARKLQKEKV